MTDVDLARADDVGNQLPTSRQSPLNFDLTTSRNRAAIYLAIASLLPLAACDSAPSPEEQRLCAQEMRSFHKAEVCRVVLSFQLNHDRNPSLEQAVQMANNSASMAADFYPWRYCKRYRKIDSNEVRALAQEC
jgi:hypothetical protein